MENKSYIYNREEYNQLNEEFLGKLIKNTWSKIKNSASKAYSKNFGSYAKLEALFVDFEKKIMENFTEINNFRKQYIDVLKQQLAGNTDINATQIKNLRNKIAQAEKQLENIKNNLYKQLDIQASGIIKNEKNPQVQELVKLKKLELEQKLEVMQYEAVKDSLSEELLKAFPKVEEELNLPTEKDFSELEKQIENATLSLSGKNNNNQPDTNNFNIEEAKKRKDYLWNESPYMNDKKSELVTGQEILYFSNSDYQKDGEKYTGSKAYIASEKLQNQKEFVDSNGNTVDKKDDDLFITKNQKDLETGFVIKIGKIINLIKKENKPNQKPANQSTTGNLSYTYTGN